MPGLPDEERHQAQILAAQLGRPLAGSSRVVRRCGWRLPVVIAVHPELEGKPFPTLYWLTCPLARRRVSRLEQKGGVRDFTQRVAEEPAFGEAFAQAQEAYAKERASYLDPESPLARQLQGGVGGARGGVKCLHAHYAHLLAGKQNPVGEAIQEGIEPLECAQPCVKAQARNPAWREAERPSFS